MAAVVLLRGTPPNRDAYWQIPLAIVAIIGVPAAVVLPRTWASVEVSGEGLFVRGRRVVPADELGLVELLSGMEAYGAGASTRRRGGRVPPRQNLYAGWADVGQVVAVEHLAPGGRSTYWLLPGPRAVELAAALEAVRDADGVQRPGDDWSRRSGRRSGRG